MNRLLKGSELLGLSFLAFSCSGEEPKPLDRPNIVLIIADDANWNDFGAYGNTVVKTPNIDRLAREGMVFTNAFVTTSSCSPSRSSILTGLYPHNTGAQELGQPLPFEKKTFVEQLHNAGYYTASAGKWHLGPHRAEFDTIVEPRDASGAADWISILQKRPKAQPFMMWFGAMDPHRQYASGIIEKPHDPENVVLPPYLPNNQQTRKELALYYDEITRLDQNIGKVLTEIRNQGMYNNTIVIFMSDNGRPFPRCKNRMYDDGIKTPFIIRWPDRVKGGVLSNSLVSSIDIAPTLCELASVESNPQWDGVSFVPILDNPMAETRQFVVGEHNWHDYQSHERAIRTKTHLYIRNSYPELNASPPADVVRSLTYQEMIRLFSVGELSEKHQDCFTVPRPSEELYVLQNDPFQMNNVAQNQEMNKIISEMREKLDCWISKTNDKIPDPPRPDQFDRFTGKVK